MSLDFLHLSDRRPIVAFSKGTLSAPVALKKRGTAASSPSDNSNIEKIRSLTRRDLLACEDLKMDVCLPGIAREKDRIVDEMFLLSSLQRSQRPFHDFLGNISSSMEHFPRALLSAREPFVDLPRPIRVSIVERTQNLYKNRMNEVFQNDAVRLKSGHMISTADLVIIRKDLREASRNPEDLAMLLQKCKRAEFHLPQESIERLQIHHLVDQDGKVEETVQAVTVNSLTEQLEEPGVSLPIKWLNPVAE